MIKIFKEIGKIPAPYFILLDIFGLVISENFFIRVFLAVLLYLTLGIWEQKIKGVDKKWKCNI